MACSERPGKYSFPNKKLNRKMRRRIEKWFRRAVREGIWTQKMYVFVRIFIAFYSLDA